MMKLPPPPVFNMQPPPKPLLSIDDIISISDDVLFKCTDKYTDLFTLKSTGDNEHNTNFEKYKQYLVILYTGIVFIVILLVTAYFLIRKYQKLMKLNNKEDKTKNSDEHVYIECEADSSNYKSISNSSNGQSTLTTISQSESCFYAMYDNLSINGNQWQVDKSVLEYQTPVYYKTMYVQTQSLFTKSALSIPNANVNLSI